MVKQLLRSERAVRSWVPFTKAPPTWMVSTYPAGVRLVSPNQPSALPLRSRPENWVASMSYICWVV